MKKSIFPLLLTLFLMIILAACNGQQTETTPVFVPLPGEETATPFPTLEVQGQGGGGVSATATPVVLLNPTMTRVPQPTLAPILEPTRAAFAPYVEAAVAYSVPDEGSLNMQKWNENLEDVLVPLVLSPEQLARLEAEGIVASPSDHLNFDDLYEQSDRQNLPIFITTDALLHTYHLLFDKSLWVMEETIFLPRLQALNRALLAAALEGETELAGASPEWREANKMVLTYLAVGSALADPAAIPPASVSEMAGFELANIESEVPAPSAVFPRLIYGEDYSQYKPRGHYTKSPELEQYFQAMMWYGRMTFRLDDPVDDKVGPEETRAALLLTYYLTTSDVEFDGAYVPAMDLWADLYDPTAFLVGRSDDLNPADYQAVMEKLGIPARLSYIAADAQLTRFRLTAKELPAPRILGLISDDFKPLDAVKGLRLMGQRFVPDGYIIQELIHPKVPERYLPSGLDVMAALGSDRALEWADGLAGVQATSHVSYTAQMFDLRSWVTLLSQEQWTETVYNGWLNTLKPLLGPPAPEYPVFMQGEAWLDKQLNTALGSWAELKHDTILYAKQPYGGLGGGGECPSPPQPLEAIPYVEPSPLVFARIAALSQMTLAGLQNRGLMPASDQFGVDVSFLWKNLGTWSLSLKMAAEKELAGQPLTPEEADNLRSFRYFLGSVLSWYSDHGEADPAAIIADVATDPNTSQVLEVATGNIQEMYAVVPVIGEDGEPFFQVARGGIYSYYEFPSATRFNDEEWRAMLADGIAPPQPEFVTSFVTPESAPLEIQYAVYRFQRQWASAMYYAGAEGKCYDISFLPEGIQVQLNAEMDVLRGGRYYEGRQWVSTDYLSAQADSDTRFIVTVRETWQDYRVSYTGYQFAWYDAGETEQPDAWRGPYSVDVSYTVVYDGSYWAVVSYEELTSRPGWE